MGLFCRNGISYYMYWGSTANMTFHGAQWNAWFFCKGNICRSAFAEAIAKSMGVDARSAGFYAIEGAPANEEVIKSAQDMGYDLSNHRTPPIMYAVLRKTDLLVAMES